MSLRGIAVGLAAMVAATLAPTSAHAAENYWPSIYVPMVNADGGEVVVQVNAGPGTWQVKQTARRLAAQLDNVTVRTSGDCATADLCVNVHVSDYDEAEMTALAGRPVAWAGIVTFDASNVRSIHLNSRRQAHEVDRTAAERRHVAAHELGHALGLNHHRRPGLMSDLQRRQTDVFSPEEVAVLNATYAG